MVDSIRTFQATMRVELGYAPEHIEPGKLQLFGPRRASWCLFFPDGRVGVFGCWRLGITNTWTAKDRASMTMAERAELARLVAQATAERQHQQRQQWTDNAQRIAKLWAECQPLQLGDPVMRYLTRRGLGDLWPLPSCLRLHRGLTYWHEGRELGQFPAMVAPIVSPIGQTVALHRTYLTADGRKADLPTPKKLTGAAGSLAGAAIPLGRCQNEMMGIAEGIETALAAWAGSGIPTVAASCASSLANWQWPASVRRIVVFADHDRAGLEAAQRLKARGVQASLSVALITPSTPGTDWCDVWAQRGAATVNASEAAA